MSMLQNVNEPSRDKELKHILLLLRFVHKRRQNLKKNLSLIANWLIFTVHPAFGIIDLIRGMSINDVWFFW